MHPTYLSHLCYLALASLLIPVSLLAETFSLPPQDTSVIGSVQYVHANNEETLVDIAREFDLGYDQIIKANPGVNRWIPGDGTKVLLPHRYLLPGVIRKGLVMNIAELRMYHFPTAKTGELPSVVTYPVSIGRMDWRTPIGTTRVIKKERDPAWHPPQSIRDEHAREGEILPSVFPGGSPDNPLGRFALRLGFPGYLIHGVDERKTYGIGMRVTHGCIRMYPEDIEALFGMIAVNTSVTIMNQPIKIGWMGDALLLEVHQPLNEGEDEEVEELPRITLQQVTDLITSSGEQGARIDQNAVAELTERGDGIPGIIGQRDPAMIPRDKEDSDINTAYQMAVERHLKKVATAVSMPIDNRPHLAERRKTAPPPVDDLEVRRYIEELY